MPLEVIFVMEVEGKKKKKRKKCGRVRVGGWANGAIT